MSDTNSENIEANDYANRFLKTEPFYYSRLYARKYDCDLAVPNAISLGNILMFTRLIDDYAIKIGRQINILTAPIDLKVGLNSREIDYPVLEENPFIKKIINADEIETSLIGKINSEQDNYCQFNHMIENICSNYNIVPRFLRPSIYLNNSEMKWALNTLSHLKRPVFCLHPAGKGSSSITSNWYLKNWQTLISKYSEVVSFISIGKKDFDGKEMPVFNIDTTIREAMSLIWASDAFIGFDSSMSHVATAFEKPACVLWDALRKLEREEYFQKGFSPAVTLRWGYPQNRNLMILGEKQDEILTRIYAFIEERLRLFKA